MQNLQLHDLFSAKNAARITLNIALHSDELTYGQTDKMNKMRTLWLGSIDCPGIYIFSMGKKGEKKKKKKVNTRKKAKTNLERENKQEFS